MAEADAAAVADAEAAAGAGLAATAATRAERMTAVKPFMLMQDEM